MGKFAKKEVVYVTSKWPLYMHIVLQLQIWFNCQYTRYTQRLDLEIKSIDGENISLLLPSKRSFIDKHSLLEEENGYKTFQNRIDNFKQNAKHIQDLQTNVKEGNKTDFTTERRTFISSLNKLKDIKQSYCWTDKNVAFSFDVFLCS